MAKPIALSANDAASTKMRQKTTTAQRGAVPSAELIPMQFRMPPDFAMAFRSEAVKRDLKYNEMLQECFAAFMKTAK
jgi:hypothetical protein